MNILPSHSAVIIVGAGPSGLMMAAQLLRYGIQPIIIDSKTALSTESKALAIQARSLEVFRQMGLDEIALKEGNIIQGATIHQDTDEVARLNFSLLGEGKSHFPFVLILKQSKTERILLDYLTANACPIYWDTQLLDVHQTDTVVSIKIKRNQAEEIIHCEWLIGADGASSKVRKSLNIPFSGGTYQHNFYLADLKIKSGLSADAIRIFLKEKGFTGIFPMSDSNYRFMGMLPQSLIGKSDISFEDLKPYLTYTLGVPMPQECCNWFSVYHLHHRMADRFKLQQCFLIGDAAHVHSPAGGQGMNTGLQDAHNLAWKLAGVITKNYSSAILDTYAKERIPVAKKLLKSTDRIFSFGLGENWFVRKLRNFIVPMFLNKIWDSPKVKTRIFNLISQVGTSYRESSLSLHLSLAKNIKAGDRLPYIKFYDEKLKQETDLHKWCNSIGFTLIVMGHLNQRDLLAVAKWIKLTYTTGLNFFYLPHSKRNQHLFDSFEIAVNGKKAIIVRPDMHIGYINDVIDIDLLGGYLKESVGWN